MTQILKCIFNCITYDSDSFGTHMIIQHHFNSIVIVEQCNSIYSIINRNHSKLKTVVAKIYLLERLRSNHVRSTKTKTAWSPSIQIGPRAAEERNAGQEV